MNLARVLVLMLAVGLFGLVACGEDTDARFQPLPKQALVMAFGDSLTYGTGAKANESYPSRLEALTGLRVLREGVPGEVSAKGVARLPSLLNRYRPDLVILIHGGNDMLRRHKRAGTKENLKKMVSLAREYGAQVALLGVPEPSILIGGSAEIYEEVAEELSVPFEGESLGAIIGDQKLRADPIHPNAKGYDHLAKAIHAFLKQKGAL